MKVLSRLAVSIVLGLSLGASIVAAPATTSSQQKTTPKVSSNSTPAIKYSNKLINNKLNVKNIPCIEAYINSGIPKPLVIVLTGISGTKEGSADIINNLAKEGFYAVAFDARAHGERVKDPVARATELEVATSQDCNIIIENYLKNKQVNPKKIGMMGFSFGGSVTYHYLAYGKYPLTAAVPCISTPYWEQLYDSGIPRSTYSIAKGWGTSDLPQTEINKYLKDNSPFNNYKHMKDTAILMINGELDDVIAPVGAQKLYDELKKIKAPHVELIINKGLKHEVPEESLQKGIEFLKKHLS